MATLITMNIIGVVMKMTMKPYNMHGNGMNLKMVMSYQLDRPTLSGILFTEHRRGEGNRKNMG